MKRVVAVIHVLLLFALLGASGCTNNGLGMREQQHPTFWSDQSVQSGEFANKPQVGTYDKDYIKSIGDRRLQSSHIV